MKKIIKNILLALVVLLVLVQFYPRAKKNNDLTAVNDLATVHVVPADVMGILKTSCYDCHSNNTVYPWYSNIQPGSWWLNDHIVEGKRELNFSEFATYRLARQYKKLDEIINQIKEDEMPLQSYTLIHRNAKLSKEQKLLVSSWSSALRDSMKTVYPADSLKRKPKPVVL